MWKSLAVLPALLLASCIQPEPRDSPSQAVIRTYDALNQQDSLSYLQSLDRDKRQVYEALPGALHALLNSWKGQHADVSIVSVTPHDTVATVVYNLKVTGRAPREEDSLVMNTYLENTGWSYGY